MVRSFWALGLVLFLAACSGGGSGLPTVDPNSTQSLTGLQPPGFSDSEIVRIVNQVLASADAILVSDVAVGQGQDAGVFYTYCDTKTICVTEIDGGYALSWDVRDIKDSGLTGTSTTRGWVRSMESPLFKGKDEACSRVSRSVPRAMERGLTIAPSFSVLNG